MYPTLFSIGGIELHSHDALIVLGGLLSLTVFTLTARPAAMTARDIMLSLPLLMPITFLCVYLSAVLLRALTVGWISSRVNFAYGTSSFGMIFGVLLTGYLAARWRVLPVGKVLDRVALVLPLAQAVGRVGCFLEGCCYGLVTYGPLGMFLPGRGGEWAYRYPTQLMLAAFNLGLFAFLWNRRDKLKYDGGLTLLYLFSFSLGRLLIDGLRDLPRVWGPLSAHQLVALAILLVSAYTAVEMRHAGESSR